MRVIDYLGSYLANHLRANVADSDVDVLSSASFCLRILFFVVAPVSGVEGVRDVDLVGEVVHGAVEVEDSGQDALEGTRRRLAANSDN